jgi:hypothetical protein
VAVTVDGRVLEVTWREGQDWLNGRIFMSDEFPFSGRGAYRHMKAGDLLFGLWDVDVHGDDLLVHTTYSDKDDRPIFQADVWTPGRS